MKVFSFRNIRILLLLGLLVYVAIYTQDQRLSTTSWLQPVDVVIFPINGDNATQTEKYIQKLKLKHFKDINQFFIRNAKKYSLNIKKPFHLSIGSVITSFPPKPPADRSNILGIMFWNLKLRYWTYTNTPDDISNKNRIRLYVIYHQGKNNQALEHSLGLQKGLVGIIHAYAKPNQNAQNSLIIAHEILHTVGATDKYDYATGQPIYPHGYQKPKKSPRYPQHYCEIMAGRTPVSKTSSIMPSSLRVCSINSLTATEINWINRNE